MNNQNDFKPYVPADKVTPEITFTSIVMGIILAVIFGAANAYLGLRVGMTVSASIPAAVISMGVIRVVMRKNSILESNVVQTIGSAGESLAAGAIFTLPALFLWASEGVMEKPDILSMTLIALLGGLLGIFFMVPLRNALIVKEHGILPYPEGTACAEVLLAGEKGGANASTVFAGMGFAAIFKFIIDGKEDYRYTVQMFKFLDSGAADKEIVEGLVSHLNDKEFLSDFGLHSMSKLDEAYDQVDIDNGGGGICSLFVPVILEQLYKIGKCEIANDILNRVLWWGERMPYWGDSLTANAIAYREDTPLQATIGSSAAAQMIIFGIFGVKSDFYGNITINPVKNPPDKNMRLINMKLRGKIFSIYLNEQDYTVETENVKITKQYGEKTVI